MMNEQWLNLYRIEIEDFYQKTRSNARRPAGPGLCHGIRPSVKTRRRK